MLNRPSSKDPHRGFGYVEFSLAEDAREAIDNMDQSELYGRVIKCNEAKPQKNANEGLGSRTAVWEQVSRIIAFIAGAIPSQISNYGSGGICKQIQCHGRRSSRS